MSGVQIMVVLIVAIACAAGMMKARYAAARPPEPESEGARDPDGARLRDEDRTLKERIAVLERIATDRATGLDHEIERLRDR